MINSNFSTFTQTIILQKNINYQTNLKLNMIINNFLTFTEKNYKNENLSYASSTFNMIIYEILIIKRVRTST